ncbi:MAG TPA: hypothetical protein VFD41_05100 [Actinomycetales bacterium]|nr:hypothetical protein [Actinomycetales bacterium]
MRLPTPSDLPTPADLLRAAASVGDALDLVPRATALITRIGDLLDRVDTLVDRIDAAVDRIELVTTKADRAVAGATGIVDASDHLLGDVKSLTTALMPAAQRFADSVEPREVDAAIALLDRLPTVLTHLDEDVLPMLQQLDRVGPDVHEILETVNDLREMLTGLPGVGLLMKRGDRREE